MSAESIYDLSFTNNRGETVHLSDFEGKPLLIVNTASKCGFTPQYKGLQELHEQFKDQGLVVLGFPCDQFAHQEPGSDDEISEFCEINYGVSFPLSTKVDVNGKTAHPVFEFLKKKTGGMFGSAVKWNFTKFLVMPDGKAVKRFAPTTDPSDMTEEISEILKKNS